MAIVEPNCQRIKQPLIFIIIIIVVVTPTGSKETSLPPISFDEAEGAVPMEQPFPQMVIIINEPSNRQQNAAGGQGEDKKISAPIVINSQDGGKHAIISNGQEEQGISSQLVWIAIILSFLVILGGISFFLFLKFCKKDRRGGRQQHQHPLRNHVELQENYTPSFSDFSFE